jgi:glutamate synthase domain-containing protein 1/glutamate synthase domain-containing protein 3
MTNAYAEKILRSRKDLALSISGLKRAEDAAEGGCGVLGFASNVPIPGRHVLTASRQMHNRGNGKGGGIAMVGLDPNQARVDTATLRSHYLLQIALLDDSVRPEIESQFIYPHFDIAQAYELDHLDDYHQVPGLSVQPPNVWRYFVRAKEKVLNRFADEKRLQELPQRALEDEFVYQNSTLLNKSFYASLGEKRAFVISHGRNLSVLKIVGYAEDVVDYYRLADQTAHVWIAHQRYPTKGRVWHPGGAHPFIGVNEALVHNGDFANYHSVSEYLRQRNIGQLFLTDTEVSVQLFDLWDRVYGYPLEITLEAMAPTSEFDFEMLPDEKKALYRAVQRAHIHGSPDGPWFFIVARSTQNPVGEQDGKDSIDRFELLGITDTSMLRPQVFALYENLEASQPVQIGLIASERQAINACLRSLSSEDVRFQPLADQYWVARGGSHTDGGAFRFTVAMHDSQGTQDRATLSCTNKFGQAVAPDRNQRQVNPSELDAGLVSPPFQHNWELAAQHAYDDGGSETFWRWLRPRIPAVSWDEFAWGVDWLSDFGRNGDGEWEFSLQIYNLLRDRRYDTGSKKRASIIRIVDHGLSNLFDSVPPINFNELERGSFHPPKNQPILAPLQSIRRLDWGARHEINEFNAGEFVKSHLGLDQDLAPILVIDVQDFPAEGDQAAARWIVNAIQHGWRRIIAYNWRGGRFAGCGIGPDSDGVELDLYGDVGDYAASGLDGALVTIHGDGQDQLGQVFKSGKLVIHGDAGQTFMYGAKGGEVYIQGSVAGRPLINAVGRPRVVINGTCLDYLAESFMAGDPHKKGGFVILNGVFFDEAGKMQELETPYPGGNLFSLASGGAIFLRDPHRQVIDDQLNGGRFSSLSEADWKLIEPYLRENEKLFGYQMDDLLSVDGVQRLPDEVYRKVEVRGASILKEDQNG